MSSFEVVEKVVVSETCLSIARTVRVEWEAKKEFSSSVVRTSSTSYLALVLVLAIKLHHALNYEVRRPTSQVPHPFPAAYHSKSHHPDRQAG